MSMPDALLTPAGRTAVGFMSSEGIRAPSLHGPAWPSPYQTDIASARRESFASELSEARGILTAWLRDPRAVADDDVDPPSREALRQAIIFLDRVRVLLEVSEPMRLPLRGVSIGAGGAISIEFASGQHGEEFVFEPDGSAERRVFVDNSLRLRHPIKA